MKNRFPKETIGEEKMMEIIADAVDRYQGHVAVLESAVGALVIGRHFGWHVLRLIHSSRTYSHYEKILGVKFRDVLPARGPLAETVRGIQLADKIGKFWQALAGGMVAGSEAKEKVQIA